MALLAKLNQDGHDTSEAFKQLNDFENMLKSMRDHRANLMRMIEQIDQGLAQVGDLGPGELGKAPDELRDGRRK
jgi:hypothetical protein